MSVTATRAPVVLGTGVPGVRRGNRGLRRL